MSGPFIAELEELPAAAQDDLLSWLSAPAITQSQHERFLALRPVLSPRLFRKIDGILRAKLDERDERES